MLVKTVKKDQARTPLSPAVQNIPAGILVGLCKGAEKPVPV